MFKRLAKSKRHSVEGVGGDPRPPRAPSPAPSLTGSTGSSASSASVSFTFDVRNVGDTRAPRATKAKQARRSCGDQPLQSTSPTRQIRRTDDHQPRRTPGGVDSETDYQMVTAVPAYIVEHEPEKQQKGLGVWGRRMSKKIDSFRRASCREPASLPMEKIESSERLRGAVGQETKKAQASPQQRSASPFKSFFIRMGSTGMLNSAKCSRRPRIVDQQHQAIRNEPSTTSNPTAFSNVRASRTPDKDSALFRSCSTSQLNTSTTYVKGDDPSEGIDLRMNGKDNKTVSCDDLAAQEFDDDDDDDDDVFEAVRLPDKLSSPSPSAVRPRTIFHPIDFGDACGNDHPVRKSASCEFRCDFRDESRESRIPREGKDGKKLNFPYAFLRSKLSVLPEERHGCVAGSTSIGGGGASKQAQEERLFKTVSEEHFPAMMTRADDASYDPDRTTTLGRRRSRPQSASTLAALRVGCRNSYSEYRTTIYEPERRDAGGQDRVDFPSAPSTEYADLEQTTTTTLRVGQRRNSAPSAEQRLSSHYVSSNESGYDSDGPRGESAAASEAEAFGSNRADSSDTSSVVDSEMEKPTRSSTPSEYTDQTDGPSSHHHHHHQHQHHHHQQQQQQSNHRHRYHRGNQNQEQEQQQQQTCRRTPQRRFDQRSEGTHGDESNENPAEGLRWHHTTSGRLLPSINQTLSLPATPPKCPSLRDSKDEGGEESFSPHRARLQQDKRRFLSDIIRPPSESVRRCRLVTLTKTNPGESLGIRLAQQRGETLRYVVVELENKGIAHRDGRLRLGDEIVEVEGRELGTLDSLQAVQHFLASFRGNEVQLLTAYDESVPRVYADIQDNAVLQDNNNQDPNNQNALPGENEYFENAKNLSNISLGDDDVAVPTQRMRRGVDNDMPPRSLSVASMGDPKERKSSLELSISENSTDSLLDAHRYLTRHVARFEKGYGRPSLGFSVVGGRDSPRGEMGIFVRRVFPGGQADVSRSLLQGDEILTLNGKILRGFTHREVIELFKAVREGIVELEVARRHRYPKTSPKSVSY